jgi:hypothetical protein
MNQEQLEKVRTGQGFIAALDQSGGSTPKALKLYGIEESAYSGDDEMFDLIHQMRSRIITSPSFGGDRVLGAILFEQTMDRQIDGIDTAEYLWMRKQVVPFLKVDKGLGRGRRRPGHEADRPVSTPCSSGPRPRACSAPRCARSSSSPNPPASGPWSTSSSPWAADPRRRPGADHRARDRHQQPGEGRGRGAAQGCDPGPARTISEPTAGDAEAHASPATPATACSSPATASPPPARCSATTCPPCPSTRRRSVPSRHPGGVSASRCTSPTTRSPRRAMRPTCWWP